MSSSDVLPHYYRVTEVPVSDDSSVGTFIHQIEPGNNNQAGLNNSQVIRFTYAKDPKVIRLNPLYTGFRVKAGFITKTGVNNDRNANTTLANNWFWHLFTSYKLKVLNQNDVENLSNIGVFADTMSLFRSDEFRKTQGELIGYIPDENNGDSDDQPLTGTVTVSAANTAANTNAGAAVNLVLTHNDKFNAGYKRRKDAYNYPVTDDTDVRYVEQFFPLSQISGFFSSDTCLMNTPFEIELNRKSSDNFLNAIFGAAGTTMSFGNTTTTGLLSVILELYEQKPSLKIETYLNSVYANTDKTPKPIAFLKASCELKQVDINERYTITETSFHVPRYVVIVFKGSSATIAGAVTSDAANQGESAISNYSLCAHADIESIQVTINGQEFPNRLQDCKFLENQFSSFYQSYLAFCKSYPLSDGTVLSMKDYRNAYTIFAFDCSDQTKKSSNQTTNLKVVLKRRAVPANNDKRKNPRRLEAFLIVLEDQFVTLDTVKGVCSHYSVPV